MTSSLIDYELDTQWVLGRDKYLGHKYIDRIFDIALTWTCFPDTCHSWGDQWPVGCPHKRSIMQSFDVIFDDSLSKHLNKQSSYHCFCDTMMLPWCWCNVVGSISISDLAVSCFEMCSVSLKIILITRNICTVCHFIIVLHCYNISNYSEYFVSLVCWITKSNFAENFFIILLCDGHYFPIKFVTYQLKMWSLHILSGMNEHGHHL